MFDIYEFNNENETAAIKASKLIENGLVKISSNSNLLKKDTLSVLRKDLEKTFQGKDYPPEINLHQIKNKFSSFFNTI